MKHTLTFIAMPLIVIGLMVSSPVVAQARPLPGVPSDFMITHPKIVARPTMIVLSGDGSFYIDKIHFTKRATTYANAVGTINSNDCIPYCAAGHYRKVRVTLLFRVVTKARTPYFNCVRATEPVSYIAGDRVPGDVYNIPLSAAYAHFYTKPILNGEFNRCGQSFWSEDY
jgi:hypothetical protein